jgi:hypothetical protein
MDIGYARALVGSERSRQVALENVEIVQRYFREHVGWNVEILGQDIRRGYARENRSAGAG